MQIPLGKLQRLVILVCLYIQISKVPAEQKAPIQLSSPTCSDFFLHASSELSPDFV